MYYKGKIYSGEPWTAEENQKLKEMAKAQKPFYEIAESFKPKRTINAVFLHAREISRLDSGVRLFDDDGTKPKSDISPNNNVKWTEKDDKDLIHMFKEVKMSYDEMAKRLGRSTNSITSRFCAICKDKDTNRLRNYTFSSLFDSIRFLIYAKPLNQ